MMLNMKRAISKRGFTLIEVLVVISIIAILSAILFASFGSAREDARNKALRSELKEVQLALELYRSQNGEYPPTADQSIGNPCTSSGGGVDSANTQGCGSNAIIGDPSTGEVIVPEFISQLPTHSDSANSNCNIIYQVDSANHSWYKLTAERCFAGADGDPTKGIQTDDVMARCPSSCGTCGGSNMNAGYLTSTDFYESFAVFSIGGQCE